jgi:protoporphyrinogen oxidase
MSEHIGIVGGGLLGLSLASRLRKLNYQVTVLEAALDLGGLASAWQLQADTPGDCQTITWDRFYHVILLSDLATQELLRELGLQNDFVGVETKTGFYTDGQLHSMSNSLEFLRFPRLG